MRNQKIHFKAYKKLNSRFIIFSSHSLCVTREHKMKFMHANIKFTPHNLILINSISFPMNISWWRNISAQHFFFDITITQKHKINQYLKAFCVCAACTLKLIIKIPSNPYLCRLNFNLCLSRCAGYIAVEIRWTLFYSFGRGNFITQKENYKNWEKNKPKKLKNHKKNWWIQTKLFTFLNIWPFF